MPKTKKQPSLKYYAVTGRIPEEEDVTHTFKAKSPSQALDIFEDFLYKDTDDPETTREETIIGYSCSMIITAIVESQTPISLIDLDKIP
jgi:hypothetical protein